MNFSPPLDPQAPFPIVFRDDDFVVIDKPSGFHVHQPELPRRRVDPELTCLVRLRRQVGEYLYPVHRIDVATSGLLLFALNKASASLMGRLFTEGLVEKEYLAIVRGYLPDSGLIQEPLALDSTGEMVPAQTSYVTLARTELSHAVGRRHASARYSLARVRPYTGRFHQIRRHMARISHPMVSDSTHGDSHHNRFFRETLGLRGLWLRADRLFFEDPRTGEQRRFQAPVSPAWTHAMQVLGWTSQDLVKDPSAMFPAAQYEQSDS
ncbi:MAG: pseudouridine synthase [Bdellovibrionaceae bacterium]|nr:pseudouridine synthase [Pseudobdellovibrionaceae bacterium]